MIQWIFFPLTFVDSENLVIQNTSTNFVTRLSRQAHDREICLNPAVAILRPTSHCASWTRKWSLGAVVFRCQSHRCCVNVRPGMTTRAANESFPKSVTSSPFSDRGLPQLKMLLVTTMLVSE